MGIKNFKPIITDRGIFPCKISKDGQYSLPLYFDESKDYWYYYDQSAIEDHKPLIAVEKTSDDFVKDVLDHFSNRPFSDEEQKYILQLRKTKTEDKSIN